MDSLDDKIEEAVERIKFLKAQIPALEADAQIAANAYNVALAKGDSVGADINRNSNIAIKGKLLGYIEELKTLTTPATGVLALLQSQKQVAINAQQKVVDTALTSAQKTQLETAQIKAQTEIEKAKAMAPKSNTTTYIIVGVVIVVIIAGIMYFKFKK